MCGVARPGGGCCAKWGNDGHGNAWRASICVDPPGSGLHLILVAQHACILGIEE